MKTDELIAIDTHTHAEVSCWNPFDNYGEEYDRAADKYFGSNRRPTIEETIAHYREKKIGLVMFTVDSESQLGRRRIPNEEIADAAKKNADMMIAFASIDPHKGKMGAREARRLIEEHGVKGFKFHPTVQGFMPYDRMAWPIYEVIAEYKLPAIFHSGHSGIGSGIRCGGAQCGRWRFGRRARRLFGRATLGFALFGQLAFALLAFLNFSGLALGELEGTPSFREHLEREFPEGASELPEGVTRREMLTLRADSILRKCSSRLPHKWARRALSGGSKECLSITKYGG